MAMTKCAGALANDGDGRLEGSKESYKVLSIVGLTTSEVN